MLIARLGESSPLLFEMLTALGAEVEPGSGKLVIPTRRGRAMREVEVQRHARAAMCEVEVQGRLAHYEGGWGLGRAGATVCEVDVRGHFAHYEGGWRLGRALCPEWADITKGRSVWEKDECAPDAETLAEAWKRLFWKDLSDEPVWARWDDGGDALATLYSGGRVVWNTCEGELIRIVGTS